MKLYDGGRAPNPRRVQIFLAEKGVDIPAVQLNLNALEHKEEEFAKRNPFLRVPILELDDGTCLSETVAICRYLEGLNPEPNLMGRDFRETAFIEMWQRRAELNFLLNVGNSFRHLNPAGQVLEGTQIVEWGNISRDRAREFMTIMNEELSGRDYIAGERYTIADITTFVGYQFLKPARIGFPEVLPNLSRWYERIMERPSSRFSTD